MKIVAIVASPRGTRGATGALTEIVLQGAQKAGAAIETVVIKGQEVKPCTACDRCHRRGSCAQRDSFGKIRERVDAADGLIFATPNYISHVSAQMKAFFDRCCGVVHLQGFEGKYGAAVVTSGGGDEAPIAAYISQFLAVTGAVPVGAVWATMEKVQGYDFPAETRDKALALGERLVKAWAAKEIAPEPYAEATLRFRERMRSLIGRRGKEWPFEYEYWKTHRGLKD